MNKVYIGLSTTSSIPSKLIRWGEETPYSHVYIRRKSSRVGEYVYQATAAGNVNFMGIDIFLSCNKVIEEYEFEIEPEKVAELLRFFIKNAGKKYSIRQILILSKYVVVNNKLGIKYYPESIINGSKEFICSELGAIVLKQFLDAKSLPESIDLITPKKLRPYLIKYGKRVK